MRISSARSEVGNDTGFLGSGLFRPDKHYLSPINGALSPLEYITKAGRNASKIGDFFFFASTAAIAFWPFNFFFNFITHLLYYSFPSKSPLRLFLPRLPAVYFAAAAKFSCSLLWISSIWGFSCRTPGLYRPRNPGQNRQPLKWDLDQWTPPT